MRGRLAGIAVLIALSSLAFGQEIERCCSATVEVRTTEGQPVPGALVRIESGAARYQARTTDSGDATVELRAPGPYRLTASAAGFAEAVQDFALARDQTLRVGVVLKRRDSVVVEGEADKLDPSSTTTAEASRDQVRSLPERVADVRNAVPLLPGVVRTPEGKLQISGTPEYRSTFLMNSVDVTDPATGSFGATVPIDVIETVRVYKSPFLAEYGRFSSAVVAVVTRRGGDKWQYELNDPTPEMRIRSGHLRGVRGFTPRLALTGPVIKRKLYFAGAGTYELRKRPIYPLPFPYNEEKSQRINAYAQLDWILRPSHFVTVSGHFVPDRANFRNLGFYTPQPTAPSWKSHEYRGTVSDHLDAELGTFDTSVSAAEIRGVTGSQGPEDLILAPNTSGGNYFFNQDRRSRRLQLNEILSLPVKTAAGKHSIRMGANLERSTLNGVASARTVHVVSLTGETLYSIPFLNDGRYRISDWNGGVFVQDGWEPIPLLRFDTGIRMDVDQVAGTVTAAPRFGVAWTPGEKSRTVIRGGFGWFYDRVPLSIFSFPYYPERFGLPNVLDQFKAFTSNSRTLSTAIEHKLNRVVLLHAGYLQSLSTRLPLLTPEPALTRLAANGRSRTNEAEFTAKLSWYSEQTWILSYVHTYGRGDINTFDPYLGEFPEPILRNNIVGTLPGIVPHRFLSWGVFPLPYGIRFAPVFEWRSGFPYSPLNELQGYGGDPNSLRFPNFLSLDTRLSKDIAAHGHKIRLSFSVFNVTDHDNWDAVRLNTADPQFGEVLGRRPRRFRLDFDWLF